MTSPQLQLHAAVLLGWTILLSGPAMAADAPTRTAPGILHEEVSISERQPLTVRPLRPDNTKNGTDPNDPAPARKISSNKWMSMPCRGTPIF